MAPSAPPILDFSSFYGGDSAAKAQLVEAVRNSCLYNGFFQITGHRVPIELQHRVMRCAQRFFELPLEEKLKIDKNHNTFNRGYELLRSQMLEVGTGPELKEGLYIGQEIPEDHPYYLQKKLNSGPNQWPPTVEDKEEFQRTSMEYYNAVFDLAKDVLGLLALTLDVNEDYFDPLTDGAVATMRMLHYPAQPKDADEKLNRGIGAHTDFGCITLLLQDEVDGLQVLDAPTGEWLDVQPVPGAYVVNLGNLFMRMANDRYKSNIHRVINKSGRERYSIPFFFSGNPDYLCECLPNCCAEGEAPKYPPITVEDMVTASYKESYGRAEQYKREMEEKAKLKMETVSATAAVEQKRDESHVYSNSIVGEEKGVVIDDPEVEQFYGSSTSEAYRLKSELVGKCMEEIGMGRFQWKLFVVTGFGWIVDNFASQGISSVQPAIELEFPGIVQVSYSSVAYYTGLILGASFWGISSDLIGRKPAFNSTLLLAGIFLCGAAGTMNFVAFSAMWAVIGTAAGGNVPVDSMIFLEFVPGSHQYLLTALSAWWNLGQLIVSLLAWVFLANFACPSDSTPATCHRSENMGWRYTLITLGALSLAFTCIRWFVFKLPETPRYLLSKGKDQAAVDAVNYVARENGKPEPLTIGMFQEIDARLGITQGESTEGPGLTTKQIIQENMKDFRSTHYQALFATRKLGIHTTIIWVIWLTIGIAYPLYFNFLPSYLDTKFSSNSSLSTTYRDYCIESAVGIVGPISAAYLVTTFFGRRWMMGISSIVTGVFLFAYVGVNSPTSSLAFACITGMLGNFGTSPPLPPLLHHPRVNEVIEYAIMYAFTPESFPAPHRGTGTGTAASLLRFGGLCASLIASQTGFTTAPIYASAALWVVVGVVCFGLPFETHGHAAI
ncbi:Clavaminate synthase-like protein [Aspergillus sclerotioniger CBS 115572]|uniref:Clavaminate synthase-like protein n=1 Tax=Aspergillus sclerotioniger CBS 115572 TaxID=1450535 RepID=A0A317VVY4_9EURO|nr:Clavaminate synthase-like protein [Aspergillus sclerotioniger CBS 115572]PWY76080.1 Clavaminate synthase-like protein [Aspergillus sclerotioniger CBS 115572]